MHRVSIESYRSSVRRTTLPLTREDGRCEDVCTDLDDVRGLDWYSVLRRGRRRLVYRLVGYVGHGKGRSSFSPGVVLTGSVPLLFPLGPLRVTLLNSDWT